MALQLRLGLLPERRHRAGFVDLDHIVGFRTDLTIVAREGLSSQRRNEMSLQIKLSSIVFATLLVLSGCTAMTGQTAGKYWDDSTITASVKSKLVAEKTANLTRIEVDTTNQVVTLSGIVASTAEKTKAEQLARQVDGVKSVNNNLQVEKQT
jgi:osmotically-inducible protein OsmY